MKTLTRLLRQLAFLLGVLLLPACGEDRSDSSVTSTKQPEADNASSVVDGATEHDLVCGSVRLPGTVPDLDQFEVFEGDVLELFDADARAAAEQFTDYFKTLEFREIERTDTTLVLLGSPFSDRLGRDIRENFYASFELVDGAWQAASGFGGCSFRPIRDGFGIASVKLQGEWPAPETTTLLLRATERNCASGQLPDGREIIPTVTEYEDRVAVVVFVEPATGGQNCQGNPTFPVSIPLLEPLGDRFIVDGSEVPERPLRRTRAGEHFAIEGDNCAKIGLDLECDDLTIGSVLLIDGVPYRRTCEVVPKSEVDKFDLARGRVDGRPHVARRIVGDDSALAVTQRNRPGWGACEGSLQVRDKWARYEPT